MVLIFKASEQRVGKRPQEEENKSLQLRKNKSYPSQRCYKQKKYEY